MIAQEILQAIEQRTDIVELITGYLPLKKKGNNYMALCPFHREKTPSFSVSPSRQIFHCFGCGKGGGVIRFLMEYEKLTFVEAVESLAKRSGVEIPHDTRSFQSSHTTSALYEVNRKACEFYHKNLYAASEVLQYCEARKMNKAAIDKFQLGYAPIGPAALAEHLRKENVSLKVLDSAKLVCPARDSGYIDLFRNRLIIPIFDVQSRVIGFGARTMKEGESPKYINSPETPVYLKRNVLYGLPFAKEAIIKEDYVMVVEGYFDMMTLFMNGLKNVVASSGTAFTEEQVRLLKRYTRKVLLVYDADEAGKTANLRGVDLLLAQDMQVKVLGLPDGFDPDSYVRAKGAEAFTALLERADTFFDYKLRVLKEQYPSASPQDRSTVMQEMLKTCKRIPDDLLRFEYIRILSERFSVKEELLLSSLEKIDMRGAVFALTDDQEQKPTEVSMAERLIVGALCHNVSFCGWLVDTLTEDDFTSRAARDFFVTYKNNYAAAGRTFEVVEFLDASEDAMVASLISQIAISDEFTRIDFNQVEECVRRVRHLRIKHQLDEISAGIKEAEKLHDEARKKELSDAYTRLFSAYKKS